MEKWGCFDSKTVRTGGIRKRRSLSVCVCVGRESLWQTSTVAWSWQADPRYAPRRDIVVIFRECCVCLFKLIESGKKKQHKHKLFGPDFPRTFLTLTPGGPWVKKFLPITGAAEKTHFLVRTSTIFGADVHDPKGFLKNFVQKKFALIFWPL